MELAGILFLYSSFFIFYYVLNLSGLLREQKEIEHGHSARMGMTRITQIRTDGAKDP